MAYESRRWPLVVTGMQREADCMPPGVATVLSGGGGNQGLEEKIGSAITDGAGAILSAGLCGALTPDMPVGRVLIASEIVDADRVLRADPHWCEALQALLPFARTARFAGTDRIAASTAEKQALRQSSGADAVDLESHIAARLAAQHGLPFAALRVVSDAVTDALPPAALVAMTRDGRINTRALAGSLIANPWQIPALIRTGRHANTAFAALLRSFRLVGPGLGSLDLG